MLPTTVPTRDPLLTSFALEFKNNEFVGDQIFTTIESDTKDFKYVQLDKLNMFQSVADELAKDGQANEVGYGAEKLSGTMRNYALKTTISREDTADGADFLNVAMDQVDIMRRTLALQREIRQATKLRATLVAASRSSDPGNWADVSGSAVDILAQIREQQNAALYPYTHVVCPKQVFDVFERHPKLLSMWFDGNSGNKLLSKDMIAQLLGIPAANILVPDGRVASARRPLKAGDDITASLSRIWGNDFYLFRKSQVASPTKIDPGLGYRWVRRFTKGQVGDNMQVRTWHKPEIGLGGADVVQQEYQSLEMILSASMGYVFTGVLS